MLSGGNLKETDARNWIDSVQRLSGVSAETRKLFEPHIKRKVLQAGDVLVSQAGKPNWFYMVQSGFIKWERMSPNGSTVLIDIHGSCEAPGELAVRLGTSYPASGIALTDVSLLYFSREVYLEMLKKDSFFARTTSLCLAGRAHGLLGRVVEDLEATVEQKISAFFLRLINKFGTKNADQWVLPLYIARKDIASAVSCRVETVIRLLSSWEKDNKLKTINKTMVFNGQYVDTLFDQFESGNLSFGLECRHCRNNTNS